MKTYLECLPCLAKNAVDLAKRSTEDETLRRQILADTHCMLAQCRYDMAPPFTARKIMDIALKHTGVSNVYAAEKRKSNALARQLLAELPNLPEYHPEQFESRLRLAAAGNILDFGIFADLDIACAMEVVKSAFHKPVDLEAVARLNSRMDAAKHILYVLDNCGEAVFDSVFMAPYKEKITLCVRGRDAFNDVTAADLPDCGLEGWKYITNGPKGVPGTILSEADEQLQQAFSNSDLIVAKGQGNFETMNEYPNPIAFLFLAKCPVVMREINVDMNSLQVRLINC